MKKKNNLITILFAVAFVGLVLTILDTFNSSHSSHPLPIGQPAVAEFRPLEPVQNKMPAVVEPTQIITPASPPKDELVTLQTTRLDPTVSSFTFSDAVPAADSPEFTADDMNACFSAYTRNRNTAENTCKGEWYPADFAPRSYDVFWCATNSGRVEWVPVRFFDGRASQTVSPYGSLNRCE